MDIFKNSEINHKETSLGNKPFSDAFVDKLNDDFAEAQKVCEVSNDLVESIKELPVKDMSETTVFVDKLTDVSEIGRNSK